MSEVSRVSFCPFAFSTGACVRLACSAALACGAALACCLAHPAMGHTKAPLISVDLSFRGAFILCAIAGEASA